MTVAMVIISVLAGAHELPIATYYALLNDVQFCPYNIVHIAIICVTKKPKMELSFPV